MEQLQQFNPLNGVFVREHDLRGLNPLNGVLDALAVKPVPQVKSRRSGELLAIKKMLQYARDHSMWVVAFDAGAYTLYVDAYRINIDICKEEEFQEVLSHRWEPAIGSALGPIPRSMMRAGYLRPIWVDFLNHFNIPEFRQRVEQSTGTLFAAKQCRALYLERDVPFHIQAASCAETRVWQELSIGPQAQQYGSVEAVWLHFVTTVGEVVSSYAAADLQSISKILTDIGNGETEEGHRRKHRNDNGAAVARVFREFQGGDLRAFVSEVFRAKGWGHSNAFVQTLTEVVRQDVPTFTTASGAIAIARITQACTVVIWEAVLALSKYRRRDYSGWSDSAHVISGVAPQHFPDALRRSGVLSIAMSRKAASGILEQTREGWKSTAAIANFGSRVGVMDGLDPVRTSFAVLCADRQLACGPSAVSEVLYGEDSVDVACLRAALSAGVSAVTSKRIVLKKMGQRPGAQRGEPEGLELFSKVVTGELLERAEWDQVWVSGLALGRCRLATRRPLFGEKGNLSKWFAVRNESGEVLGYRLREGELVQLRLRLDDGSFVAIEPQGGTYRERFKQWHASMPHAEDADFDWL